MNVALLTQVRDRILAEPKRFEMSTFFGDVNLTRPSDFLEPGCGTTACIAGWTLALTAVGAESVWWNAASKALDLTLTQTADLFYDGGWPDPFRSQYWALAYKGKYSTELAQIAARRIDHLIATGE